MSEGPDTNSEHRLTEREREILLKAAEGLTDKQIAADLGLAVDTVLSHWKRARKKVGASSRTEAVATLLRTVARQENELLFLEIAEHTRAEAALQESEAKLHLLLGQLPASLWTTDTELVIKSVAGAGLPHLGDPTYYVGASLREMAEQGLLSPSSIPAHDSALDGEEAGYKAARKGVSFVVRVAPLRGHEGRIDGCIGMAIDTTEQAEAEAKLLQTQADYQALVDQAFEGIYICDAEGNYLYVNPSGCDMLGYTLDELKVMGISDVIDPDDLQRNPSRLGRVNEGESVLVTRRLRKKSGEVIDVELSARKLSDGNLLGVIRLSSQRH